MKTNIALKIKKLLNLLEVAITNSYEFSSMRKGVPIIIFGPLILENLVCLI